MMDSQAQKTCSTTALLPEVPFVPFLAGLTAWALLKISLEFMVQRVNPEFFDHLKTDVRRRYNVYFGTWLGTMFKVVSITACTASLFTVPAETDIAGLVRPLSTAEQWCWGCRAIIYIQELPHIASIPELVIHHILSIGTMISILAFNIPRRQMYVAWAGLWSEFVSNARRLLKMHGKLSQRLSWWLGTANVLLIVAFRVAGCFVAIVWTLQGGTRGTPLVINIGCWTIYLVYMLQVSLWEAKRLKLVSVDLKQPATIIIAERFNISFYGIIMGLALVCTELSALFIYEVRVKPLSSVDELHSIAWATLQAVLVGLLGGYIVPIGLPCFTLYERVKGNRVNRGSMLVGFLFAAAMLLVTPTIHGNVDKHALLACVVISWPLLDAMGYVASLFEGVGSGKPTSVEGNKSTRGDEYQPLLHFEEKAELIAPHQSQEQQQPQRPGLLPLQLIGALLSLTMYYCILSAVLFGLIDNPYKAAILAFALRASVGRFINPRRKDISLTTVNLPLVVRDEPVELFRIYSLAAIHLGGVALFWIDTSAAHSSNPNSSSILRRILFHADHPFKRLLKWPLLVYLVDVLFKVAVDALSRPRPRRSSRQRGTSSRKRATSTTRRRILQPKFMASAAGLALVGLVILAVYSDGMPKVITSVEEAQARGVVGSHMGNKTSSIGGGLDDASRLHFVLQVFSSWQFAVSTLGVAVLPVVIMQLVN